MKEAMLKALITSVFLAVILPTSIKPARLPTQTPSHERLIVGVLRPEGVIVPFAQFSNGKWTNPWHSPRPVDQPDEPETIADLPKPWYESLVKTPGVWYLATSLGDTKSVTTSKSIQVCSHCQHVWGLISDYPNPKQSEENECARNLGVAFSEKTETRSFERLTSEAAEWKQVLTVLEPEFEQSERAASNVELELNRQYLARFPAAEERAKVTLSILNLYRSRLPEGPALLYFETSKEYPKPHEESDAGCNNISLFSGWLWQDSEGKLTLLDSHYEPTDCDMKEGGLTQPFAILHLDGKTFAIVEEDSYEGEGYTVLEIGKATIRRVLETYAGSC